MSEGGEREGRTQRLRAASQVRLRLWSTAGLFKLTYYSTGSWMTPCCARPALDSDLGRSRVRRDSSPVRNIWTLETTHRIALFARKWNQSRLVAATACGFPAAQGLAPAASRSSSRPGGRSPPGTGVRLPLLGCHGGSRLPDSTISVFISSWLLVLYGALAWAHTQLIIAYIIPGGGGPEPLLSPAAVEFLQQCLSPIMLCVASPVSKERKQM